ARGAAAHIAGRRRVVVGTGRPRVVGVARVCVALVRRFAGIEIHTGGAIVFVSGATGAAIARGRGSGVGARTRGIAIVVARVAVRAVSRGTGVDVATRPAARLVAGPTRATVPRRRVGAGAAGVTVVVAGVVVGGVAGAVVHAATVHLHVVVGTNTGIARAGRR